MLSGDCNVCINRELPSNSATCVECGLSRKNYKPMTNGDRIRSMSDEELAGFLATEDMCELICAPAPPHCDGQCKQKMLDWFKQEALDDEP